MTPSSLKIRLASLALIVFALHSVTPAGCPNQGDKDPRFEKVDKVFAQWDKPDSPGCELAVIKDEQIVYKRGYGMANLEHNIPMSPASIMDTGSVSKQFTAMAIALLAEQGKLSIALLDHRRFDILLCCNDRLFPVQADFQCPQDTEVRVVL